MHIFPSSTVFIRFSNGSVAAKAAKKCWAGQTVRGAESILLIFASQHLCHSALHIAGIPKLVTLINIKMDMCYDGTS